MTLDLAKVLVDAAEAKACEEGWRINVAVVNDGAHLVEFRRMDDAYLGSIDLSIEKARSSARFLHSTRELARWAFGEPGKAPDVPGFQHVADVKCLPGGLPIFVEGVLIGAIGVSGASPDQDEECARIAIEAVVPLLRVAPVATLSERAPSSDARGRRLRH